MAKIIRARLYGPNAAPGLIAAADVARMILGLERAIAQAAYVVLGQPRRGSTGRHRAAVEAAAQLRFIGVQEGSLIQVLALPEPDPVGQDQFDLDAAHLSSSAFERLIVSINDGDHTDPRLAGSIAELAEELGIGERHDRLILDDVEGFTAPPYRRGVIDREVRERMRAQATPQPSLRNDTVVGTLVEADFERGTARLQPPVGGPMTVRFPPELADDIQAALRQPAELEGAVAYDPSTATATSVTVQALTRGVQLAFGLHVEDFWRTLTFHELQTKQGTTGVFDVRELGDPGLDVEDRIAFASLRDE